MGIETTSARRQVIGLELFEVPVGVHYVTQKDKGPTIALQDASKARRLCTTVLLDEKY